MTSGDEQDVAGRLGDTLQAVRPSPAPVAAVLRKGRAIRLRRIVAAVAAAAAVAAISAVVPVVLLAGSAPAPPAAAGPTVTVHRPGPHSPPGLIAWGLAGGHRWRATVRHSQLKFCIAVTAVRPQCASAWYLTRSYPVNLSTVRSHGESATAGPVWNGVTHVGVLLPDTRMLELYPVNRYGLRWIAFVLPARFEIVKIVAYSARGELAYATPRPGGKITWHGVQ